VDCVLDKQADGRVAASTLGCTANQWRLTLVAGNRVATGDGAASQQQQQRQ